jgi:hypothetical protein
MNNHEMDTHNEEALASRTPDPGEGQDRTTAEAAEPRPATVVSIRKIEANRRNAQRSTGPTTPEGKARVARNALKHGLLARDVIIVAGDGQESEAEFYQLLDELYESHEPVGATEQVLVQNLAANRWRKWRVLRAEMGAIRATLDNVTAERARALADKVNSQENRAGAYVCLPRSSVGIDFLFGGIDAIRELLSSAGPEAGSDVLADENITWLEDNLGWEEEWIKEKLDGESEEEPRWSTLIEALDECRAYLVQRKPDVEREEALALEAEKARLAVPDDPAAERRLRYEKAIDAEFYRTLATLEAVQRARRSRPAPAAQGRGEDA